jgi:hypothetical protein
MQIPEEWASAEGWEPVMLKPDVYAIWERPWEERKEVSEDTSQSDEKIHLERLFGFGWTPDVSIEIAEELALEQVERQKKKTVSAQAKESFLLYERTG